MKHVRVEYIFSKFSTMFGRTFSLIDVEMETQHVKLLLWEVFR
jgi:hypothetical protein